MSGGARARLFVTVDPPRAVREQLALWARTAAAAAIAPPTLRLLDPDLLHLTLCFLGEQPPGAVQRDLDPRVPRLAGGIEQQRAGHP